MAAKMHLFLVGIILGWGAAIPIGPVNLEVVRRHLAQGARSGLALGLGACSADVTYITLLIIGVISLLSHPLILNSVGLVGGAVLIWFGIGAMRMPADAKLSELKTLSAWRHYGEGYLMTFLNPYTILFWSSMSAQIANLSTHHQTGVVYPALGVLVGTLSWICLLNGVLFVTRHRLSASVIRRFNVAGGIILLLFGGYGISHVLLTIL